MMAAAKKKGRNSAFADGNDVIAQCNAAHGGKYKYDVTGFVNGQSLINIYCSEEGHGWFKQKVSNHVGMPSAKPQGCPKCGKISTGKALAMTFDQFQERGNLKYGKFIYTHEDYIDINTKTKVICVACDNVFFITPSNHLDKPSAGGCCVCANISRKKKLALPWPKFIEAAHELHGDKYVYDEKSYIQRCASVRIKCSEHGWFIQSADVHLQNKGCYECGIITRSENAVLSQEKYISDVIEVHGDLYNYSMVVYIGMDFLITILCKQCGECFEQNASGHKQGSGCPSCVNKRLAEQRTLTHEQFSDNCVTRYGDRFNFVTEYTKGCNKITIMCNKCGALSTKIASGHYSNGLCAGCAPKSYGEKYITEILRKHNIEYHREFRLGDNRPFDFCLPALKVLIEYDGAQHFKFVEYFHRGENAFASRLRTDIEKSINAVHNGYTLIRIDYTIAESESIESCIINALKRIGEPNLIVSSCLYDGHCKSVHTQTDGRYCVNYEDGYFRRD